VIARLRSDRWSLWVQMAVAVLAITTMSGTRPTATYRTLGLGGTAFEVGIIQSAYSVLPALTAVVIGRWVDRFGEVLIYSTALVVLGLGSLLSGAADSLVVLGLGQAMIGFGTIAMLIASQTMIANRSNPESWTRNYGTYAACLSLGQLIGPAIAAAIVSSPLAGPVPERPAFGAFGLIAFAGAALVLVMPRARVRRDTAGGQPQGRFAAVVARILRRRGMVAAMFVSVVVLSAIDLMVAYLPVLGETKGLSVALVGLLLSVRAGTTLVSRLFMDRLLNRFGWVPVLAGSLAIAAASLTLIPFTTAPVVLVVLMGVVGLGIGFGQPMAVTFVARLATDEDRATATAVRLSANRISLLFVPAVMGAVAGAAGVDMVFWILAGVLAAGSAVATTARLEGSGGETRTGSAKPEVATERR
jgi:MFS family permease